MNARTLVASRKFLAVPVLAAGALLLSACGASAGPDAPSPSASAVQYVAFGDSWPFGAHCGGCTPFPELYAEGLDASLDAPVDFSNLTTNGGTSGDLRNDVESSETTRAAIADAEIIIISTGANDMEPAFESWLDDTCGGADQLDCFREIAVGWEENFEAILTEIDGLRGGQPTAVRILTNANEFLDDPGLLASFGADFGLSGGATITGLHHEALCAAAERHGAICVDLRPVLNGPDFTKPADVNSRESMQLVADALLASGLDELGTTG